MNKKIVSIKFMFSKNATKIDKIFTINLTLCSKCQIHGEDFVNFCGLLRKHELYRGSFCSLFLAFGKIQISKFVLAKLVWEVLAYVCQLLIVVKFTE